MNLGIPGLADATEIGTGSSSVVYRSRRLDDGVEVAVKVLNLSEPAIFARFEHEVAVLKSLSRSPGIVTVHETGTTATDKPYLVLDLCNSSLLDRVIDGGPVESLETCRIIASVADTVADAHLVGVVHRDLKPANILLSSTGSYLVADFGIATMTGSTSTQTSAIAFSAGYVAPETLGGEAAGRPADVYALGATMFHMVTGSAPFIGEEAPLNVLAIANRVANERLPDLRREGVPDGVCAAIEAAMAKRAELRPDIVEFREQLETILAVEPRDEPVSSDAPRAKVPRRASSLIAPPTVPGYVALRFVGRGSTGAVFAASPDRPPLLQEAVEVEGVEAGHGKDVAIKVLDDREFDPDLRRRILERLDRFGRLRHRHLAPLLDYGFTSDGRPFTVGPMYPDRTLADLGGVGDPVSWPRLVEIGIEVGSAIDRLERSALVHGNLHPSSVYIDHGQLLLGDYPCIPADGRSDVADLGALLFTLAGTPRPSSGERWIDRVSHDSVLGQGPASLRSLLAEITDTDDRSADPDPGSGPGACVGSADDVVRRLQLMQADVGLSVTPALLGAPRGSGSAAPPSEVAAADPVAATSLGRGFARFDSSPTRPQSIGRDWIDRTSIATRGVVGVLSASVVFVVVSLFLGGGADVDEGSATFNGPRASNSSPFDGPVVPAVAGVAEDAAVARVANAGFVAVIARAFDEKVAQGLVVGSSPESGTSADRGTTIDVVVSIGPEPACADRSEEAVRQRLDEQGLLVAGVMTTFHDDITAGRVVRCVTYEESLTALLVVSNGSRAGAESDSESREGG